MQPSIYIRDNKGVNFMESLMSTPDINEQDDSGKSLLIQAFEWDRYFHAKILLELGADPSTTWHDRTIVDIAIERGNIEMIQMAAAYQPGMTPLMHVKKSCLVN